MDQQIKNYFEQFKKDTNQPDAVFGDVEDYWMPEVLVPLILKGEKTATAMAYDSFIAEKAPLPEIDGSYSVLVDANELPVGIIRSTKIEVVPFLEVSADHAYKEGEGDKSLEFWREGHRSFYKEEAKEYGFTFNEATFKCVLQEFEVVYQEPLR